jgi:hypothetical protein
VRVQIPPIGSEKGDLRQVAGSRSDIVNQWLVGHATNALWLKHSDAADRLRQMQAGALMMADIAPLTCWRAASLPKWSPFRLPRASATVARCCPTNRRRCGMRT